MDKNPHKSTGIIQMESLAYPSSSASLNKSSNSLAKISLVNFKKSDSPSSTGYGGKRFADNDNQDSDDCEISKFMLRKAKVNKKKQHQSNSDVINNNNPMTNIIVQNNEKLIEKIYRLLRNSKRLLENNLHRKLAHNDVNYEWKEAARRIDLFLFIVSCTIVVVTPCFLFAKFVFFNGFTPISQTNKPCSCGHD
jgi:hypothetical protein